MFVAVVDVAVDATAGVFVVTIEDWGKATPGIWILHLGAVFIDAEHLFIGISTPAKMFPPAPAPPIPPP